MSLYLVRHAKALSRTEWEQDDRVRPLSPGGHRQAIRLVEALRKVEVARLVSSPYLRCRQTLEPLAAERALPLELDERFAEGGRLSRALQLLESLRGEVAVVCGHGDLIPQIVARWSRERSQPLESIECEKGSVWVLEEGPPPRARYVAPPARGAGGAPDLEPRARRPAAGRASREAEPGERAKERLAVLDLGSTSFHLLVADATPLGEIERVVAERSMLRLGALLALDRAAPEEVCVRAVETARTLRAVADEAGARRLLPVATAALREAPNGPELAARISAAVAEPVRMLSGEEEARLMFAAFRHRLQLGDGATLGIDLGGGSLELALGDADRVHWEETLPLGVARLHGELVDSDPVSPRDRRALRRRVRERLAPRLGPLARRRPTACVATGGTVAALARLVSVRRTSWPRRSVSQLFVPMPELRELAEELAVASHAERMAMPGMARARVDLLPTGALVLVALVETLGLEGFTVSDWGLREGVILESLGLAHSGRRRAAG